MRAIGVLMALSGLAAADSPAKQTIPLGPSKVVEVEPWTPPAKPTQKFPGMKGTASNAVVIAPDPDGDARPWPYGIWIRPPAFRDDNVIRSGTSDLPDSAGLAGRLSRQFDDGVGTLLEWLMTPRFVQKI
jgi:hypothetical protein